MEEYKTTPLSVEDKEKSIRAINCLNEIRSTYSFEGRHARYLLGSKTEPITTLNNRAVSTIEVYSTTNGLVKRIEEKSRKNSVTRINTEFISINCSHGISAREFPIPQHEISETVSYFGIKPSTILPIIDHVEKELRIDLDRKNLQTNSQDNVFF